MSYFCGYKRKVKVGVRMAGVFWIDWSVGVEYNLWSRYDMEILLQTAV